MSDTPDQGSGEGPGKGAFSQDDIDALLHQEGGAGGASPTRTPAADASPAGGPSGESPAGTGEEASEPAARGTMAQSDIDALLGAPASGDEAASAEPSDATPAIAGQSEVDMLIAEAGGSTAEPATHAAGAADTAKPKTESAPDTRVDTLGRPFDEMAAAMASAIAEEGGQSKGAAPAEVQASSDPPPAPPDWKPLQLEPLAGGAVEGNEPNRVSMLNDVNLRVKIELGHTRMLVEEVLKLGAGSVVELEKLAGDPVDVFVNDRLIARGEVLVLNDSFCVRVCEVLSDDPHRITT